MLQNCFLYLASAYMPTITSIGVIDVVVAVVIILVRNVVIIVIPIIIILMFVDDRLFNFGLIIRSGVTRIHFSTLII